MHGDQDEFDSNFMQLLALRGIDDQIIKQIIEKKTDKYTSPQIQNEILSIIALRILRDIGDSIRSTPYYSLMADEVTDSSNREQVVICLRWVEESRTTGRFHWSVQSRFYCSRCHCESSERYAFAFQSEH